MTKNVKLIDKIAMVLLLIAPILGIYGNPDGWNYETIATLPLSAIYFVVYFSKHGNVVGSKDPMSKGLIVYFIYWGLLAAVLGLSLPINIIQAYLAFFMFYACFDLKYYTKVYKVFAIICIVFFFLQEFTYITMGARLNGILSFLPLYGDKSMAEFVEAKAESARSCAFFSEPAHFAQFLLPLFALELYREQKKPNYVWVLLIGATILFLRSGNGLFGLAAMLAFAFPYFMKGRKRNRWLGFFVFGAIVLVAGYYYVNSEMGAGLMERQAELSMDWDGRGSRSGFLRIWRGFFVFGDYTLIEKLLGCPNEMAQLAHVSSSGMLMVDSAELYFNMFQKILLNTGLVGLGIFVFIVIHIWSNNTICGKAIIATLVALSFIAAIYMSHTMILYMVLAESMKPKYNHKQIIDRA